MTRLDWKALGGKFAVRFRVGSQLITLGFNDRDEAWSEFMYRGRDPRFQSVGFFVRPAARHLYVFGGAR